jgi:hypothetical protein
MMNLKPELLLLAYQDEFVNLCLDDACPAALLWTYSFNDEAVRRETVIEFIYECMRLKLIEVDHRQAATLPSEPSEMKLHLISLVETSQDWVLQWHMFFFVGTKKLNDLLEKHGLKNWEAMDAPLNMAFINEVFAEE